MALRLFVTAMFVANVACVAWMASTGNYIMASVNGAVAATLLVSLARS